MRFASSISSAGSVDEAVDRLLEPIDKHVTPGMVDFALLFSTAHFEDDLPDVVDRLASAFCGAVLIGCTAEGTIGHDREIEGVPSMSLLAGSMPGVLIRPFHLTQPQLESAETEFEWERLVGASPDSKPVFVAMADPFRLDVYRFVEKVNDVFRGAPLTGGIASAGHKPRQNRLIANGEIVREGVVGVAMTGRLEVKTVVSQGCRPVGRPFVITKGDRNVVLELGGRPVLERLHEVLIGLPEQDKKLANESLFIGRVIDEYKGQFAQGDFLIHNIIGVDRLSGAIGIAGHARVGATVQFHVRDAESADEDLRAMLSPQQGCNVCGAMLFGCNARGTRMWSQPGHDVGVLRELLGDVPVGGFFCGGEFGPIGGRNFIHSFTASIGLLCDPRTTAEKVSG